jgi:photosystem II stability/assembly factor-like uncharacterized protein
MGHGVNRRAVGTPHRRSNATAALLLATATLSVALAAGLPRASADATTRPLEPNVVSFWSAKRGLLGAGDASFNSPGEIELTTDGGRTFKTVLRTTGGVVWVDTAGDQDAWAVVEPNDQDRSLLHSSDGGLTWQVLLPYTSVTSPSFGTTLDGLAVIGDKRLLASSDGGTSWQRVNNPCPSRAVAAVATTASADDQWVMCLFEPAVSNEGKSLYETHDGGQHWRRLFQVKIFHRCEAGICSLGYPTSMSFSEQGLGALISDTAGTFVSRNGGRHWVPAGTPGFGLAASMVSKRRGFLLSYGRSYRLRATDDGGRSWSVAHSWR